jgi:hypothetical protein
MSMLLRTADCRRIRMVRVGSSGRIVGKREVRAEQRVVQEG